MNRPADREPPGLGLASPGAYAVLVGTGHHVEGSQLSRLPGVDTTLDDLQSLLEDACRMAPERILRLPADASPPDVVTVLENTVEHADGPVLFYYVGHGLLGPKDDLYLASHGSRHAESISHAVPYRTVQDLLGRAAGGSAVILDCCFSGRAGAPRGRRTADPFASARPDGSFLLTSSSHFSASFAPLGARHTLFSGRLLELLRDGDPGGPPVLTLDDLHGALLRAFADGPVTPRQWSEGTLGRLVVAANRAYHVAAEPQRTPPADVPCPYPGMKPFAAEDHIHFTGRDDAVAELVTRVCRARSADPVVLVGPSGVGKSSLLRAGLLAELQLRHEAGSTSAPWPVLLLPAPGAKPLQALARLWSEAVDRPFDDVLADLTEGCFPPPRDDRPPCGLLVVDQFEEIFARASDPEERRRFIRLLCGPGQESETTARLRSPRVVIGVRADHYGSCLTEAPLAQALARGQISLTPMSNESLRTAIEEPARRAGLILEPGLVQRLLHDLRERDTAGRGHGAVSPETAPDTALPFLAHALRETWLARDGAVLTLAGYQATGGIWQSVATATERLYADLDEPERAALRHLLLRMVEITSGGEVVRRPLRTTEVGGTVQEEPPGRTPGQQDGDESDAVPEAGSGADVPPRRPAPDARVLDRLARARLVTVDRDSAQISHEALLHTWPRLNTWIRDAQHELPVHQQLTEDAALWLRHGRGAAYLYTGDRLAGVRPWLTSDTPPAIPLDTTARAFLEASVSARHRRTQRTRVYLSIVLCVLLAASATFATLWNSATQQRERAQDQQRRSVARSLVLQADALRYTQADDALRFGAAAQRLFPTPEGRTGLVSTLVERHRVTFLTGHTGPVKSIAYRPDGRVLATASTDRTVILWNAPRTVGARAAADRARPHRIAGLPRQQAALTAVGFSPDGRILAVGSQDRSVTLWNVADAGRPRRVAELRGFTRGVEAVVFSPDRRSLLTGGAGTDAVLWDVTKPRSPRRLSVLKGGSSGPVHGVAFSPDGHTAVVDGAGPAPTIWSLTDRSEPVNVGFVPIRGAAQTEVFSVSIAADGDTLAAATSDNGVSLWSITQLVDTRDQQPLATLSEHAGPARGVAFSRDGRRLATVGHDGTAQLWDVRKPLSPRLMTRFTDHRDAVTSVAFASDSRTIATASDDGRAAVWELADSLALRRDASTSAPNTRVPAAAFTPDRRLLTLTQAYDENNLDGPKLPAELWDATRPTAPRRLSALDAGDISTAAFSRDVRLLATGSSTGTIRLWDIADTDDPRLLDTATTKGDVLTLAFSADGRALAVASDDFEGRYEEMELWDVGRRGALRRLARLPLSQVNAMTFSPAGPTLAVATEKQGTSLWDISSPSRPRRLGALGASEVPGVTVEFSPDGRRLALADASEQITLYGITEPTLATARPRLLGSVGGNIGKAAAVAFDSTGTMLAASTWGESDRTLLWDCTDAARPLTLASVAGDWETMGELVLFTPDRRRLITAGEATTELDSSGAGEKVRPAQLVHWGIRQAVAVVDDPIRAACAVTGQGLTDAEWDRYADGLPQERTCPGE